MKMKGMLLVAALAAVLAGCATPAPPAGVVLINAERLGRLVEISPIDLRPTETGTLRATIEVRNLETRRVMVEGRASFSGGKTTETPTAWQRLFIEPASSGSLEFLSLATAQSARIELREGQ